MTAEHKAIVDRIMSELRGSLVPILIALLAWLGSEKLNTIEKQLEALPEYLRHVAVLQAQIDERQGTAITDRDKVDRIGEHVIAIDGRVQQLEAEHREFDRRLNRVER